MRTASNRSLARLAPWLLPGLVLLVPLLALARGGGGEHYSSPSSDDDGGGGGIPFWLLLEFFELLVRLTIRYPQVMLPLIGICVAGWFFYRRNVHPTGATKRAFQQREAEQRTTVSSRDVQGWVNALRLKDPQFELQALLDKTRKLFLELQDAWFKRDMSPVRPFLSDATYQRFDVQLQLMAAQGVRDAITDIQVLDVQLIGLDQSQWFDTVHLRVRARMRDADVAASASEAEAITAAKRAPLEAFTEVWSFVRKPGVQTRVGEDLFQGKCPNCGAPYKGGAANRCEYCGAIVNSGNYDWTLSEITQGIEHVRHHAQVDHLLEAREADPALNLEILEDRTSLLFWKWIDAQSRGTTQALHKVASADAIGRLDEELGSLSRQGRRKVFLECAVGGVITRSFEVDPQGFDKAHVEVRWSARMGMGPLDERPPSLPTVPQRWVFTLLRKHGARTNTDNGMSTNRCPQCNAPLTDSAAITCDYCGTSLGSGERDWVLASADPFESWDAREQRRFAGATARRTAKRRQPIEVPGLVQGPVDDVIADPQERQRLLYMMAALASADGTVDSAERKLLELCARRWSVPWSNVEMALNTGPQLFTRLVQRGTPEAEVFLRNLVEMALVDGRIDRKERRMLEFAAGHLGLVDKLPGMLGG
ncbi:TIM44-like domain-containing protein [Archangium violaceum]|uniref:TIM44-like domain-containing protein n=1 Tax=Archangium violaceum TaxID=83451 RepID=UPI001951EFF1|nr:TIM44-like domain-containing protein [Archangium violaceum]QRN92777.1 TIM44-like domain-containing protein [Archangium violaceum]